MKRSIVLAAGAALVLGACSSKEKKGVQAPATATPATGTDTETASPVGAGTGTAGAIEGKEVTYEAGGQTMKGYLVYDPKVEGKRPGVLVIHEWWGHDEFARGRAEELARMGYTALAVDMYGDGKTAAHPVDAGKFAGAVMNNLDTAKERIAAGLEVLRAQDTTDPEHMAAIGYCFGGSVVLHAARFGMDLDGVVSFHGSLATKAPAEEGEVKAEVLVFNGADDTFVKPEEIEAFKKEMEAADVTYEFVSFPGVKHSFTNPKAGEYGEKFGLPLAYDKQAAEASWNQMKEFFDRIFAG